MLLLDGDCGSRASPALLLQSVSKNFSKGILHFHRVRCLGSSEDSHDSVSFSFVLITDLTSYHLLL